MKFNPKLINDPLEAANELIEGLVEAYRGECYKVGTRSIVKSNIDTNKVALLVGGGAGHEPIYHGLIGQNMADGAACGDIFAAPAPPIVLEATRAVDQGQGVLYLYGNYAGDVMNFDLAAETAANEGINIRTVLIADDVASAPPHKKNTRRGIAGLVPIVKIAGAASQTATDLDALVETVERACLQTRSIGAALSPGSIPATNTPTFELEEGMIGLGMGIHGELGVGQIPMTSADKLTPQMLNLIIEDFDNDSEVEALKSGDSIIFMINSLGATTVMECLICMRAASEYFEQRGIEMFDVMIGPYVTCQEMAGVSFSITRVDQELKELWSMPCQSFCYSKMQGPLQTLSETPSASSAPKPLVSGGNIKNKISNLVLNLSQSDSGLTIDEAQAMLLKVSEEIIKAEPLLSQADRDLGDGDHGLGMKRGFTALTKNIKDKQFTTLQELFDTAGTALLTTMGGASGVVFGSLFLAGNETLHEAVVFGSHELAHLLNQALTDIMKRGGAKPGDKTMIDALHPAVEAAKASRHLALQDSITVVAKASITGKEESKNMIASMGRAKTLGKKSLGLPDAGALSVSIILETMRGFICK